MNNAKYMFLNRSASTLQSRKYTERNFKSSFWNIFFQKNLQNVFLALGGKIPKQSCDAFFTEQRSSYCVFSFPISGRLTSGPALSGSDLARRGICLLFSVKKGSLDLCKTWWKVFQTVQMNNSDLICKWISGSDLARREIFLVFSCQRRIPIFVVAFL